MSAPINNNLSDNIYEFSGSNNTGRPEHPGEWFVEGGAIR